MKYEEVKQNTDTDMTRLFFKSTRSETIRCRASAANKLEKFSCVLVSKISLDPQHFEVKLCSQ